MDKLTKSVLRNMSVDSEITLHDSIKLNSISYVSNKNKVNSIDKVIRPEQNERTFENAVKRIKAKMGSKQAIVARADATHYDFVNGNWFFYILDYIKQNAKTWIYSKNDTKWGKPVQTDHVPFTDRTIGRIAAVTPVIYKNPSDDLFVPNGHIELIYFIPDKDAIEKIIDGRYHTLSVSAASKPEEVTCSICGLPVNSFDCDHQRGKTYDVEDEKNPDKTYKQLSYWRWGKQRYTELSFTQVPADEEAANNRIETININGDEYDIGEQNKDSKNVISQSTVFSADISQGGSLTNIKNIDNINVNNDKLLLTDSIISDTFKNEDNKMNDNSKKTNSTSDTIIKNQDNDQQSNIDSDKNNNISDCGCDDTNQDSQHSDENEQKNNVSNSDKVRNEQNTQDAVFSLVIDMLENRTIDNNDAAEILMEETETYIKLKQRSSTKDMLNIINQEVSNRDAKLSTKQRKRLPDSAFCGPNRSFPVPDCAHVTAARRLIGRYKGPGSKKRIKACIERKAKALGCDKDNKDNKSKDYNNNYTNKEDFKVKYSFETKDELLDSPVVREAVDKIQTEAEQKVDSLKQREDKFVSIAIDSIIDMSLRLNKPLVKDLKDKKDNEFKDAKESISKKLKDRGIDALSYMINDLKEEMDEVSSTDKNQEAVKNAINNDGSDTNNNTEQNNTDNKSDDTEQNHQDENDDEKPGEENNQQSASDSTDSKDDMPSFAKPVS